MTDIIHITVEIRNNSNTTICTAEGHDRRVFVGTQCWTVEYAEAYAESLGLRWVDIGWEVYDKRGRSVFECELVPAPQAVERAVEQTVEKGVAYEPVYVVPQRDEFAVTVLRDRVLHLSMDLSRYESMTPNDWVEHEISETTDALEEAKRQLIQALTPSPEVIDEFGFGEEFSF